MTTKELVEWLEERLMILDTSYREDEKIKDEIIRRLKEKEVIIMGTRTIELINWLQQWDENYKREEIKEITERLEELDELKKACLNAQKEELKRMKRKNILGL